jgi:hypothetical protein
MRKLLLASAATFGATFAMSGGAMAQPAKPVEPGTIAVHLNGYIQFEIAGYGSSVNTISVPNLNTTPAQVTTPGVYKLNPITTDGDFRLKPGFDAETLSGLAYGAAAEIRTTASDAAVGAGKVAGSGSSAGTEGLYVKRAYGYVGAVPTGFVRLGQTDSAFSLMQSGVVENFGDGAQFNTDGGESSLLPTDATPGNFVYADASNLYATDKLVYISPALAGFSLGAGYEPNSNGLKEGYGNNAAATDTSAALSASPVAGDIGKRRKNTIDGVVQYALKSGGVAYKASAGLLYGAPIAYSGAAPIAAAPRGYDNLEVYQIGGQVTFAGLTLGANIKGGQVEDSYSFKPKGTRDAFTYIVGASYVLGPYVLGASFYDGQSSGAYAPGSKTVARTLSEYGVAAGGNYVISPNASLFLQYEYGHKHQPGAAYAVSSTAGAYKVALGNLQAEAIAGGVTLNW